MRPRLRPRPLPMCVSARQLSSKAVGWRPLAFDTLESCQRYHTRSATPTSASGEGDGPRQRVRRRMPTTFDPTIVESGWMKYWQEHKLFTGSMKPTLESQKPTFSMIFPPPNITGNLHLGHALTLTIQDALARWKRMKGYNVLWIPGLDHAGIATQTVVEKKVWREKGQTRYDLGREAFIQEVWKWHREKDGRIKEQLDRLGGGFDWSKEFFTLDRQRSVGVVEAFVRLHDTGKIYRKRRIVSWCPHLNTAISDIELDHTAVEGPTMLRLPNNRSVEIGVIHKFAYPLEGGGELEVATTRPETMLGDTAVAIHPDDPRYKGLHGKSVIHPFSGRRVPIVLDEQLVDMELGTGVVKVTPAHDPNDYECGMRHSLEILSILDTNGKMSAGAGEDFAGKDRFEARDLVLERLADMGLYRGKEPHPMSVARCSRTGDIVEPLLVPQWYVKCAKLGQEASDWVREGTISIWPEAERNTWHMWLDKVTDWCISRQLWWGHRIPAYRVVPRDTPPNGLGSEVETEIWVAARSAVEAEAKAAEKFSLEKGTFALVQDEDVLDTWFSSALLPLSALGWPQDSEVLTRKPEASVFPLSLMETGSDILFFWVARMAMMSGAMLGRPPFSAVVLHPMVRDRSGRKMSKSLGNVIDPLHVVNGVPLTTMLKELQEGNLDPSEVNRASKDLKREFPDGIPTCGADSLRFALAEYLQQGSQINLDPQRVISANHFCNKIWNASKFVFHQVETSDIKAKLGRSGAVTNIDGVEMTAQMLAKFSLPERWIFSRLATVITRVNTAFSEYELAVAAGAIRRFFWNDFCDVYLEVSKLSLNSPDEDRRSATVAALVGCLDVSLRMLHPLMPFLTEELWQRMHSVCLGCDAELPVSVGVSAFPQTTVAWVDEAAEQEMQIIRQQARLSTDTLSVKEDTEEKGIGRGILRQKVDGETTVMMQLPMNSEVKGKVAELKAALDQRLSKAEGNLDKVRCRLRNKSYLEKVPEHVKEKDATTARELEAKVESFRSNLSMVREFAGDMSGQPPISQAAREEGRVSM